MREPKYSGPGRTGTCVCGHLWEAHHLGVVAQQAYIDETKEGYIPQECEFYGCNEMGGMMWEGDELVPHCSQYRDSGEVQTQ